MVGFRICDRRPVAPRSERFCSKSSLVIRPVSEADLVNGEREESTKSLCACPLCDLKSLHQLGILERSLGRCSHQTLHGLHLIFNLSTEGMFRVLTASSSEASYLSVNSWSGLHGQSLVVVNAAIASVDTEALRTPVACNRMGEAACITSSATM